MPRPTSYGSIVLGLASALARERGWNAAAGQWARPFQLDKGARLALRTRGHLVVAVATFVLDPVAPIGSQDALATAIVARLADIAAEVSGERAL